MINPNQVRSLSGESVQLVRKEEFNNGLTIIDNKFTQELEQTSEKIPNIANAKNTINVLNPYGNFQNIHPKTLYFAEGLWGYKFWKAYTPYPNGNIKMENPCYTVSNDGESFNPPTGVTIQDTMLDDWPGVETAYNNDTHLVYRSDIGILECWWRYSNPVENKVYLYRRTTDNGRTWTAKELMFEGIPDDDDHICPSIIYENGKYKMLSVNTLRSPSRRAMYYSESTNGKNWTPRLLINLGLENGKMPWHMDFINDNGVYRMVIQVIDNISGNNDASLYYTESTDLKQNWSKPINIISPTKNISGFDNRGIYRATIVKVGNLFYVYYSAISTNNRRSMALSIGENPLSLHGYDGTETTFVRSSDIVNTLEVRQETIPERFGGLKVGNLIFADGATDGVPPQDGSFRYAKSLKELQRYDVDSSSWRSIGGSSSTSKRLIAEKNAIQILTPNQFDTLIFGNTRFVDGTFTDNKYTINGAGTYRVTVGLTLNNVVDGDTLEIWVRIGESNNVRPLVREKMYPIGGIYYVNASIIYDFANTNEVSIVAKYGGSATNAQTTQYIAHNFLAIERVN